MADPLILYSTNTWLAYKISERYYGELHYVWCAPVFDAESDFSGEVMLSTTSNPVTIYRNLRDETRTGDRHSAKVQGNKVGILRGATRKRTAGLITESQERDIVAIVDRAETMDLRPPLPDSVRLRLSYGCGSASREQGASIGPRVLDRTTPAPLL
jgi:hypothetical protein